MLCNSAIFSANGSDFSANGSDFSANGSDYTAPPFPNSERVVCVCVCVCVCVSLAGQPLFPRAYYLFAPNKLECLVCRVVVCV